jgi:hypothetical protein
VTTTATTDCWLSEVLLSIDSPLSVIWYIRIDGVPDLSSLVQIKERGKQIGEIVLLSVRLLLPSVSTFIVVVVLVVVVPLTYRSSDCIYQETLDPFQ